MTRAAALAVLLLVAPAGLHAQSGPVQVTGAQSDSARPTTEDGVAAFAAGDYERAVAILQPLAWSWPPDQVAAFFLAMLYDVGRGVPADPMRACALNFRVNSLTRPSGTNTAGMKPFQYIVDFRLLPTFFFPNDPDAWEECETLAALGFDSGFEPVTFQLEPEQSVAWDLLGTTVTYQGKTKRFPRAFNQIPGTLFLPLQHTELLTGSLLSERRHFIEMLFWQPGGTTAVWQLEWHLSEVVRNELLSVAGEIIATSSDPQRPSTTMDDVRKMVQLKVNDDGDVEWVLSSGPEAGVHLVPSEADRAETRKEQERQRAHEQALARARQMSQSRVYDASRQPSMSYGDAEGCRFVYLAGWSADRTEAITIYARTAGLDRSTTQASFNLASPDSVFAVDVHVYNRFNGNELCSDFRAIAPGDEERLWHAVSGTVTMVLAPARKGSHGRDATVTITNAEFISESGQRIHQTNTIVLTAKVGFIYGD